MTDIYSLTPAAAEEYFARHGFSAKAVRNIFTDLYRNGAEHFSAFSATCARLRETLEEEFYFESITLADILQNEDTVKYLFKLSDGCFIETVLMKQKYGGSVCISTQCGCNMGCAFCSSGRLRKQRNLTAGEMVLQVLYAMRHGGVKITNITVMGIGEPLDNFDNLCGFLDIASHPFGLEIGSKHITVSTCGIVPKIPLLAKRENPCHLAISLHAPDDELRNRLMPINRSYSLSEVIKAAGQYADTAARKVLVEYIMLDGINDSREQAGQLAGLIGNSRLMVNLIPYNSSPGGEFKRSGEKAVAEFYDELKKRGISVTKRKEFGGRLNAACGQLRSDAMRK